MKLFMGFFYSIVRITSFFYFCARRAILNKPFQIKADYEHIFKEYFEPLCNFINRYISNWEDSREIVQKTFFKIWQNREKIVVKTTTKNYLFQAAKNTMIDHIRRSKKEVELSDGVIERIEAQTTEQALVDESIIKKAIIKGLSHLKPKNRKIFELNKFEGLTYKEIAEHLQISERAVEDNIARALKSLRNHIEKEEKYFT